MSEGEFAKQEPQFAAFIGIDWADKRHVWCLQAMGSEKRESGELKHTPEAVEAWVGQLYQRFGNRPIAVALEQSRGALVFMLSKYEVLHLFPVPSTMVASMRQALYPSGAKDDPRDADLLLDILVQHRDKLRRLVPDTEATRRVQNLVEERRRLVDEKTEQSNRLTSHLKIYFPQMLDWFEQLDTQLVCGLLLRWPTLEELQKAPPAQLRRFFRKHHCRDQERIERRILAIRQAIPAIGDRAVIEAKSTVVKVIVGLIRSLLEGIADLEEKIEEGSAGEVQTYSGIAPVMEKSGKKKWVHCRIACPKFLRQSFHEWAGHSIAHSVWARSYYQQLRSRGKGHHAAVRALAFKWIRILFRWKDGVAYDESKYLAALTRRSSPLTAVNVAITGRAL